MARKRVLQRKGQGSPSKSASATGDSGSKGVFAKITKAKNKDKKGSAENNPLKVFGSKLATVSMQEDLTNETTLTDHGLVEGGIPWLPKLLIEYLEEKCCQEEGLFRVAGYLSEIKDIKARIDKGVREAEVLAWIASCQSVHSVAGLLKLYLRELSEPLLTYELYDCFVAANGICLEDSRLSVIHKTLGFLPRVNLFLLKRILEMLRKVTSHCEINKMSVSNLAIIFAPTLIKAAGSDNALSISADPSLIAETNDTTNVMISLIEKYDQLFTGLANDFLKPLACDNNNSGRRVASEALMNSVNRPLPTVPRPVSTEETPNSFANKDVGESKGIETQPFITSTKTIIIDKRPLPLPSIQILDESEKITKTDSLEENKNIKSNNNNNIKNNNNDNHSNNNSNNSISASSSIESLSKKLENIDPFATIGRKGRRAAPPPPPPRYAAPAPPPLQNRNQNPSSVQLSSGQNQNENLLCEPNLQKKTSVSPSLKERLDLFESKQPIVFPSKDSAAQHQDPKLVTRR